MALRKQTVLNIGIVIAALLVLVFVMSPAASQIITKSDKSIAESGEATDMSFFAGEKLRLSLKSTDDVFVAGGEVIADKVTADHLVVAGGEVTISDVDVNDIMTAAGKLSFKSGTVSDDIVAAAGDMVVNEGFNIGGSAVLTGGNVTIDAPISGELRVAAAKLRLNADVNGNAQLIADDIYIGPEVKIDGDLRYRGKTLEISPTAVVTGAQVELAEGEYEQFEVWGKRSAAVMAAFVIAFLLGILLLVVFICMALPGLMASAANMMREKPLPTLAIGFLITVIFPAAIGLLFASVLGVPLAILLLIFFVAIAPIAIAAASYFIGMEGRKRIAKKTDSPPSIGERIGWPLLAFVVLVILGLVPFIGKMVWVVIFAFGMGAVATRGGKALAEVK
ncbi:MAG: hypothetical protein HKO02_03065 [Hyphomonadaceae bacterium]|nr:hypothetical protein [Hyphomonadaceae bacterium]